MTRETTSLVARLWASDAASALTNEAAREIERLRATVAEWIEARRRALSKQGVTSGHYYHDLALLEQAMEAGND